jgi:uncharacterized protein
MRRIIDFHTHAFPDALAGRAMAQLHSEVDVLSYLDGRVGSLLDSMDKAGIEKSVLCCIATRPAQFEPIFDWCVQVRSERILPFPSVHPDDPQATKKIALTAEAGFLGMKFHPYYQNCDLDDPRMEPIYHALCEHDLILTAHTGFDIAFERVDRAGPKRILNVLQKFPRLRLVTTHLGSWQQWEQVEQYFLGKPIYMDISVSREFLGEEGFRRMLLAHPAEYLLFGTDSPWADQAEAIRAIEQLALPASVLDRLFCRNASSLLRI